MNHINLQNKIYEIRAQKVMLDFDLALLYKVENRALKQAIKRNRSRFPSDFMFMLTQNEWQELITNCDNLNPNYKFSPALPFAFTEQGVALFSGVLKSEKAIAVNIAIMRAFVFVRQYALSHKDLTEKLPFDKSAKARFPQGPNWRKSMINNSMMFTTPSTFF